MWGRTSTERRHRRPSGSAKSRLIYLAVALVALELTVRVILIAHDDLTRASNHAIAHTVKCVYTPLNGTRPVLKLPTVSSSRVGHIAVRVKTNVGDIDLTLSRSDAPCLLHSFASLITQGFYSRTSCLRVGSAAAATLSCGVRHLPARTGYTISRDLPSLLSTWPAGSVAMARSDSQDSDGRFSITLLDPPSELV
jgi:hypothetical protein